jgi:diguanylate cyclase (GGDEF)-like protein
MLAIDSVKPHYFNRDHARLATAFADQVAIVIENARLFQEARQAAERRAILYRASQEFVAASQDEEHIKTAIHDAVSQLMPAEAFMIGLVDETQNDLHVVYACNNTGRLPEFHVAIKGEVFSDIFTSGKTIFVNDIEKEAKRAELEFDYLENTQSILAVPIRLGDKAIGVLTTQSYNKGAYILEDLHLLEMLAAHTAITLENSRLFRELNRLAITDPLTGLYNRRGLEEFGKREVDRTRRFHRPLSAIMLDIDFFKHVNDTHGHSIGDQVLNSLVRGCRIHVRDIDIVGRYGGEEIIILLPETNLRGGCLVAGRLRSYVESNPFMTDVGPIHVTISLGVAEFGRDTPDLAALMDKADKVMYMAKQAGRNRVMPELHPEQSSLRGSVGLST